MSKIRAHVCCLMSALMPIGILLGTNAWAQVPSIAGGARQNDPFEQVHSALSSAADNLLTAAAQPRAELRAIDSAPGQSPEATGALNTSVGEGRKKALQRVEQLRPVIEPILREEGVPTQLAAVVLIESGGQPAALSSKGARGVWQFMPDTARRYGLTVSPVKDERLDVQKATRAAARYLRDLYARFGDWPLALAAYNAGEEAVSTAVEKASRKDFRSVSDSLPLETRKYVPAVLGATGQMSNPRTAQLLARSAVHVLYAVTTLD